MIKYVFKEPLTIQNAKKANPQKIGESLSAIAAANKGRLTPHAVVDEARNERHALHRFFEWRDEVAAAQYRLDQARNLIRSVRVVNEEDETEAPAFISINEKSGVSYRSLGEVLESADLQALALAQAEKDMASYEKRLRMFEDVCDAIKTAREKIAKRRSDIESGLHVS